MDSNQIGAEGAKHLAEGLKENKTLTSLEYAAAQLVFFLLSAPA